MSLKQIEKLDNGSIVIKQWHPDRDVEVFTYETAEDLEKISPILSKEIHGTTRDVDFVQIWEKEDGTPEKIDGHIFPKTKSETSEVSDVDYEKLSPEYIKSFEDVKTDVDLKVEVKYPKPVDPVIIDDPVDDAINP